MVGRPRHSLGAHLHPCALDHFTWRSRIRAEARFLLAWLGQSFKIWGRKAPKKPAGMALELFPSPRCGVRRLNRLALQVGRSACPSPSCHHRAAHAAIPATLHRLAHIRFIELAAGPLQTALWPCHGRAMPALCWRRAAATCPGSPHSQTSTPFKGPAASSAIASRWL